jgi:imidazolonepropionase
LRGARGPRCGAGFNELGIIQDGSLLIRDGVLVEVGPTRRVENLADARRATEVNAAGCVVMPGFVDSHTHLLFPPPGAPDTENAAGAIRSTTGQRLEVRARGHLRSMARHGTTTVEVKTGCGPDESAEAKLLRVLATLKHDPLDVLPTVLLQLPAGSSGAALQDAAEWACGEFLPKVRRRRLALFADAAWECDPERRDCVVRYLEAARRLGLARKVHADRLGLKGAITTAVEQFAVSIDHLDRATAAEAALLAGSCTVATLLPWASFHLGCGTAEHAPARALIDAGVPVALASNFNPRHTPTLNMQTVMALACLQMGMTEAEAICAATINGAHALGRGDVAGSLEPGKSADVLILNTSDYRDLGHDFGMNLVRATMKRGELIYQEGEVAPLEADRPRPAWQ